MIIHSHCYVNVLNLQYMSGVLLNVLRLRPHHVADIHHIVFSICQSLRMLCPYGTSAVPSLTCEFHMLVLLSADEGILEDLCSTDDHV